jgi:hypothetical protein
LVRGEDFRQIAEMGDMDQDRAQGLRNRAM